MSSGAYVGQVRLAEDGPMLPIWNISHAGTSVGVRSRGKNRPVF